MKSINRIIAVTLFTGILAVNNLSLTYRWVRGLSLVLKERTV